MLLNRWMHAWKWFLSTLIIVVYYRACFMLMHHVVTKVHLVCWIFDEIWLEWIWCGRYGWLVGVGSTLSRHIWSFSCTLLSTDGIYSIQNAGNFHLNWFNHSSACKITINWAMRPSSRFDATNPIKMTGNHRVFSNNSMSTGMRGKQVVIWLTIIAASLVFHFNVSFYQCSGNHTWDGHHICMWI